MTLTDPSGTGNDFGFAVEIDGEPLVVDARDDSSDARLAGVGLLGTDIYMQAMFFDPLADGALHTAQTNGLRLTIGY